MDVREEIRKQIRLPRADHETPGGGIIAEYIRMM